MIWVSPEERRRLLWEEARRRILGGDCSIPTEAPQPTGGVSNTEATDDLNDRITAQDAHHTDLRRRTRQKTIEIDQTEDETLRADAERRIVRLGIRERPIDPSQSIAATMIAAQKGINEQPKRITAKTGTGRNSSRGLLHPGNLLKRQSVEPNSLGPLPTVLVRPTGEHQIGSRVIA